MALNLSVETVSKKYKEKEALCACSFSLKPGVTVVRGPNGCGKSTLLRVCALLEFVDAGSVAYSNGNTILVPDLSLKRRFTLVLPKVGVFNSSVFKNAAYGLKVRGAGKKSLEERTMAALEAVGLAKKRDQNGRTLSSGETQRLGLARAIAIAPEILFLDEPTASIDEENTRIVEDLIFKMKKAGETKIVMTTHDRDQAVRLADTVIEMRGGKIIDERAVCT